MTERERFWSYVDRSGDCWIWNGARAPGRWPYGTFRCGLQSRGDRAQIRAHRYAFAELIGLVPPGRLLCHRCDNPPCVNPSHLFIGSPQDNMADMWAKGRARPGRFAQGRKHYAAKITPEIAQAVRECVARGEEYRPVGAKFGISKGTVCNIIKRRTFLDR